MKKLIFVLVFTASVWAQDGPTDQTSMPSKSEISELTAKAEQKVDSFEEAVRNAKPHLDQIDPKFATNYLDAASTAHTLIKGIQKSGPSAYALVALVGTLDDLALDGSTGSVLLLKTDEERVSAGKQPDSGRLTSVLVLSTASTACNDISELILHATLRFVSAEERLLGSLLDKGK